MNVFRSWLISFFLVCTLQGVKAQDDTATAHFEPVINNNQVIFQPVLRPLQQVAGAPEAFYSYFWEFGDGTYSFEKEPIHIYKDTGIYDVRLFATNNYDDGKKPNTKRRRVPVRNRSMMAVNTMPSFFNGNGSLEIKTNQQPRPGEDMVLLVGYRKKPGSATTPMSGSIMLLYNEKQFSQNSFDIADVRSYHNETKVGFESLLANAPWDESPVFVQETRQQLFSVSTNRFRMDDDRAALKQYLRQEMNSYRAHNIWRIENVQSNEEKFMFISLNTLPEMIQDTNAVVTIAGLFVPDDPLQEVEKFSLDLQIVASHDPNRIMLKKRKLSYRFTSKKRDNIYKIQFQNTGKGPAKKVEIGVSLPGMLNAATINLVDMKPSCTWCDSIVRAGQSCIDTVVTADSIKFIFNNIYLPGMQQEGISDPDSTQGFVRYKIRFSKKMKKLPFTTRAAIVFDKNEPVYTNRSVGKFRKGFSPGIILGYDMKLGDRLADIPKRQYKIGFAVSEFAAYRKYFQWEIYFQSSEQIENFLGRRPGIDTAINGITYVIAYRDDIEKIKTFSIELVPLEFRYNLTSFMSAGAGALVATEVSKTTTRYERLKLEQPIQNQSDELELDKGARTEYFANWRGALFADIQLGRVRVGPVAGIRFLQYVKPSHQRLVFYLGWKF